MHTAYTVRIPRYKTKILFNGPQFTFLPLPGPVVSYPVRCPDLHTIQPCKLLFGTVMQGYHMNQIKEKEFIAWILKGNKGQNQYLARVFIGKIQITFKKCVLYPDKVIFDKSPLKVGIRSLCWDHRGRNSNKLS